MLVVVILAVMAAVFSDKFCQKMGIPTLFFPDLTRDIRNRLVTPDETDKVVPSTLSNIFDIESSETAKKLELVMKRWDTLKKGNSYILRTEAAKGTDKEYHGCLGKNLRESGHLNNKSKPFVNENFLEDGRNGQPFCIAGDKRRRRNTMCYNDPERQTEV